MELLFERFSIHACVLLSPNGTTLASNLVRLPTSFAPVDLIVVR